MQRLFVYGTLQPGQSNEHILREIGGSWKKGTIRGILFDEGWGAELNCPGVRLDPDAAVIQGYLFQSDALNEYWLELDEFEGEEYKRVITTVTVIDTKEILEAYIYVLR